MRSGPVRGMFSGSGSIGRKAAKMLNREANHVGNPCQFCHAQCGSQDELMSHFRKHHPKHYENLQKKSEVKTEAEAA